jgi:hypothetical protein
MAASFDGISVNDMDLDAARLAVQELKRLCTAQQAELDRCHSAMAQWPTTEDGALIVDGTVTWCSDQRPFPHEWKLRLKSGETLSEHCRRCKEKQYSTPEAARKATSAPNKAICDL